MPRRSLLLPLLAAVTIILAACGGSGDSSTTTAATVTTTVTDGAADAERLGADRAEDAAGAVSVCGPITATRALLPGLRRFDAATDRLQVSTLGFPDGDATAAAFELRQAGQSEDCDVYLARDDAEVRALATGGSLFDLAPALETWEATPGGSPLRPVLVDDRAFGLPLRGGAATGVLVVSVHGRNPGGALELVRLLAGARAKDPS